MSGLFTACPQLVFEILHEQMFQHLCLKKRREDELALLANYAKAISFNVVKLKIITAPYYVNA